MTSSAAAIGCRGICLRTCAISNRSRWESPFSWAARTYESIGKALPGRVNIVLSRSTGFAPNDCVVVNTLDAARFAAGPQRALMVIGGAEIYRQCLPEAWRIHLTLVHTRIEDGDTEFSGWRGSEWKESSRERHEADDKNAYAYSFVTLERIGARRAIAGPAGGLNPGAQASSESRAARARSRRPRASMPSRSIRPISALARPRARKRCGRGSHDGTSPWSSAE